MSAKNSTKYRQPSLPHSPKIQRVGEYHLGKKINEGGFGKVVEATHIPTGHKVAIKIINKASSLKTPTSLKNLKREIKIQKMLQHKSIAALYETYETSDNYYLIMELCNGGDLMDKVAERKYLKEQEAKRYIRQIMTAVEHLHTNKIVHRDIKLENILLDENDDIRIIDFGLSNTISYYGLTPQPLTTQCGSESYAAPEILMGQPYDAKIDVWSIGVTLYAMLTGKFPYTSRLHNRTVKLKRMLDRDLHFPPGLSTGAINFIKTLLQPDPKKRPTLKMALKNKWLSAKSSI